MDATVSYVVIVYFFLPEIRAAAEIKDKTERHSIWYTMCVKHVLHSNNANNYQNSPQLTQPRPQ
jgi:hypothetical protein